MPPDPPSGVLQRHNVCTVVDLSLFQQTTWELWIRDINISLHFSHITSTESSVHESTRRCFCKIGATHVTVINLWSEETIQFALQNRKLPCKGLISAALSCLVYRSTGEERLNVWAAKHICDVYLQFKGGSWSSEKSSDYNSGCNQMTFTAIRTAQHDT